MSALLNGLPNPLKYTDDIGFPAFVKFGLPFAADGSLAIQNLGVPVLYHQGLPFTVFGRLCVDVNGTVARFGSGSAPFDENGILVFGNGAIDHFSLGVPYTAASQVAATAV